MGCLLGDADGSLVGDAVGGTGSAWLDAAAGLGTADMEGIALMEGAMLMGMVDKDGLADGVEMPNDGTIDGLLLSDGRKLGRPERLGRRLGPSERLGRELEFGLILVEGCQEKRERINRRGLSCGEAGIHSSMTKMLDYKM